MLAIWGITDRGSVRSQNQDYYAYQLMDDTCAIGVVCDGMGGAKAGNIASRLATETFMDAVITQSGANPRSIDPKDLLLTSAEQANQLVFFKASTDSDCLGMGTTMVAAFAADKKAVLLNIGDSRGYFINSGGIRKVTRDHSVVEDLVICGRITPEEARQHPQKNLITRALGAEEHVRADLFELDVQEGEFLLLCSDGLSNTVSDQEILYEVIHGGSPESCCERLLNISLSRGAPDNVTALLFRF